MTMIQHAPVSQRLSLSFHAGAKLQFGTKTKKEQTEPGPQAVMNTRRNAELCLRSFETQCGRARDLRQPQSKPKRIKISLPEQTRKRQRERERKYICTLLRGSKKELSMQRDSRMYACACSCPHRVLLLMQRCLRTSNHHSSSRVPAFYVRWQMS